MTCSLRSSALFNHVALIRKLWIAVAIRSNEQGNHPIELLLLSHFASDLQYTVTFDSLLKPRKPLFMSFTADVKDELTRVIPTCSHCDKATLAAIARIEGTLLFSGPGRYKLEDCYGNQLGCASRHSFFAHPL